MGLKSIAVLQWGRAFVRGKTRGCRSCVATLAMLQWGRAFVRGKTMKLRYRVADPSTLQWGRAFVRGKTWEVFDSDDDVDYASMGPRFCARKNLLPLDNLARVQYMLQWGRAFVRGKTCLA